MSTQFRPYTVVYGCDTLCSTANPDHETKVFRSHEWKEEKKTVWSSVEVPRRQHISLPITRQHITERHPGQQAASSSAIAHSGPGGPQMSDWSREQWQQNRMSVLYDWPLSTNIRPTTVSLSNKKKRIKNSIAIWYSCYISSIFCNTGKKHQYPHHMIFYYFIECTTEVK